VLIIILIVLFEVFFIMRIKKGRKEEELDDGTETEEEPSDESELLTEIQDAQGFLEGPDPIKDISTVKLQGSNRELAGARLDLPNPAAEEGPGDMFEDHYYDKDDIELIGGDSIKGDPERNKEMLREIKSEILRNKNVDDFDYSTEELMTMLETRYREGAISEDTYNAIKKTIEEDI
jgi:uncharacterized membrane protein